MGAVTRGQLWMRTHPVALDVVLPPTLFAMSLLGPELMRRPGYEPPSTPGLILSAVACGALVVRRKHPLAVLGFTAMLALFSIAFDGAVTPFVSTAVAAYTLTSLDGRRLAGAVCGCTALTLGLVGLVPDSSAWPEVFNVALAIGFAGALGRVVRHNRQRVAEMEERARHAEHTREEEARRRVAEERLRIARELHDVVGHHIALINVQATVATHVLDNQPGQAKEALSHVRQASRTVLEEISILLGVLRQPDEEDEAAPTEPVPSLARLDNLIASFAAAGMPIEHTGLTPPPDLPTAVDLAAYRVVQESLTNVSKHAGGARTAVDLVQAPGELRVEVRNARGAVAPTTPGRRIGRGIAGMRERVSAVGGRLETGTTPDGGFRVRAVLPVAVPEGELGR